MTLNNKALFFIIACTLIVFAFGDVANTIVYRTSRQLEEVEYGKISIFFRAFFEIFVIFCLFNGQKISFYFRKLFLLLITLVFTSTLGFLFLQINPLYAGFWTFIVDLNKSLFLFICFYFIFTIFEKLRDSQKRKIFKIYEIIIYVNGLCAILGLIFDIPMFYTYTQRHRFGFSGFLPAQNEASLFWLVALFYGYAILNEEKRKLPLIMAIAGSVLLGTKAALISVIVSLIWFGWKFHRKAFKKFLLASIFIVPCFLSIFFKDGMEDTLNSFEYFQFFIYRIDKEDALTLLLSGRNTFMDKFFMQIDNWNFGNYLFGGYLHTIEMDIFDSLLFYGIIGLILYFVCFGIVFRNINSRYRSMFVSLYFSMAALGGHVFWSAVNTFYIVLFILRTSNLGRFCK
jgi:hypothetical protein